jgi:hypothetical protein
MDRNDRDLGHERSPVPAYVPAAYVARSGERPLAVRIAEWLLGPLLHGEHLRLKPIRHLNLLLCPNFRDYMLPVVSGNFVGKSASRGVRSRREQAEPRFGFADS